MERPWTSGKPSNQPALVVAVSLLDASGDYDEQVTFLGREVRLIRVGTGGQVDDALVPGDEVGGAGAGDSRHRRARGARHRAVRGRSAQDRDAARGGHRCARYARRSPAQRAAGVGRPARPDGDAGIFRQCARRRARRQPITSTRRGFFASTPPTSPSPTPPCSTCSTRFESVPVVGQAAHRALRPAHRLPRPGAVDASARRPRSPTPSRAGPPANATSSWPRTRNSSTSAWTTSAARPSSPRRSRTTASPSSPAATSTWSSTAPPSRSTSSSNRRCWRR